MAFFVLCALACKDKKKIDKANASIDSIINLSSWTYVDSKDREKSVRQLDSILQHNPELDASARFKIYGNLCSYYYVHKKNMAKAMRYADSMILVIEKSGNYENYIRELALGYYSKGDVLFAVGRYDDAYKNYYRAKQILALKKDSCTSSDYSYRIGMVLYKQAKYADAAYFFNQGYLESENCVQDFAQVYRRQELLNNAALCYAKQNKTDSALQAYNKALAYIDQNDTFSDKKTFFDMARGVVYGNIGGEYFKKKDFKEAEFFFKKSIAINGRPGYENADGALTKIKLGKLYLKLNRLDEIKKILQELRLSLGKLNSSEVTRAYNQLDAHYQAKAGNVVAAYDHLSKYLEMTDSVQNELDKLRATDINEHFRNLDSQSEIDYLKREKQWQGVYLFVTVVFSIMAIIIILLIVFYWRKSRNSVNKLTELNNEVSLQKLKLEETLIELEKSNGTKDSILRAVAHDLRNPIAGIDTLVDLAMLEEEKSEDKHLLIKQACANALQLINELIEAAENQNLDQSANKWIQTDLVRLIADAIELMQFKANEKQQQIHFKTTAPAIDVKINEEKITRVLDNLMSNAIKFSDEGAEIMIEAEVKDNMVLVAVKDHGMGIPQEMQADVFQLFTSAKRPGTKGEKSYGLGLSIAKQIIEAHGGQIWLESNAIAGTTFYFSLPIG